MMLITTLIDFKMNKIKLEPGMLIKTSYGEQHYRIKEVSRGCTCPNYVDTINMKNPPDREPHIHIVCSDLNEHSRSEYYLNCYNEETLHSLDKSCYLDEEFYDDYIIILEQDKPIQLTLFK